MYVAVPTPGWTVLSADGPFTKENALAAAASLVHNFQERDGLEEWFAWIEPGLCEALHEVGNARRQIGHLGLEAGDFSGDIQPGLSRLEQPPYDAVQKPSAFQV